MSEFVIKIQAPELANAITALAKAFSGQAVNAPKEVKVVTEVKEIKEEEKEEVISVVEESAEKEEEKQVIKVVEEPVKEDVKITEVEVRAKFVELTKKGKREELKAMLTDFGVAKVSDLKPEQYADVMAKLEAM